MTGSFVHETLGQRVVVDAGGAARRLAEEIDRLGAHRVMLIAGTAGARVAAEVASVLPVVLTWSEVTQHVPIEVAERARTAAQQVGADAIVSVGGGSTTGLAKAVALTTGLPIVAVPTTYAGSEATAVWGLTTDRTKTTGFDPVVLPRTVIYDATLTRSLPVELSVASGFNALAHGVDSMWAPQTDPINQTFALEGIRALVAGLPAVVGDPQGLDGRQRCLVGAYLAAVSFASAGLGLHHRICHVLGGTYDLPHAQTHAVVLPHVLAYNAPGAPGVVRRLARALGARLAEDDEPASAAVAALVDLGALLGAPVALRDVGLTEGAIPDAAARIVAAAPPGNPTPITQSSIESLLRAAWAGQTPRAVG